jgi:hypothetical protein
MLDADIERAPWPRRTLANLVDAAIAGGVAWSLRARAAGAAREALSLLAPGGELIREQLASPGQRLAGVRTVDRRTGRRLALWRTLVLIGVRVGGQLVVSRVTPAAPTAERNRALATVREETEAARREHAGDPEALREALLAVHRRHRIPSPNFAGLLAPALTVAFLNRRLRRRLAPTVEVRARS